MKTALPLLLLFVLLLSVPCQGQPEKKIATVSGAIQGATQGSIDLEGHVVPIDPSGKFRIGIDVTQPHYGNLQYNGQTVELYLEPQKELVLSFTAANMLPTLRFNGDLARINQFLMEQRVTNKALNDYLDKEWYKLFSRPEDTFLSTIASLRARSELPLDRFLKQNPDVNPWFATQQKTEIRYSFDWFLVVYPVAHRRYTGKKTVLSARTQSYLGTADWNNPALLESDGYKKFVGAYLDQKVRDYLERSTALKASDNRNLNAAYVVIPRLITNPKNREYWLYQYLYNHIDNDGISNIQTIVERFDALCTNGAYRKKIDQFYSEERKNRQNHLVRIYKTVGSIKLEAHIFQPRDLTAGDHRPAIVFFHGGSWSEGKPDWHFPTCQAYAEKGMVGVAVEYRTYDRQGVLPFAEVADAKSLFRWLRLHSDELHIDPSKIVASGNSAGGHLILCAAMLPTLDEPGEDRSVSSAPNALILNAAVYDLNGASWWDDFMDAKSRSIELSPTRLVRSGLPPMLMFHGTDDHNVPYETAKTFAQKMKDAGNDCEFHTLDGAAHVPWFDPKIAGAVSRATDAFLKRWGYLK